LAGNDLSPQVTAQRVNLMVTTGAVIALGLAVLLAR